eukprot:TRINITY_DN5639_c1_g2_i1.p1 TRINITY_DN5639_c1_g2~~TRINITY_DN5639_c1_g2_i1.p1  ORF type:complete len:261 (+),score=70.05 TRINITY_DN5639_c1_g2_i1:204-986(+)
MEVCGRKGWGPWSGKGDGKGRRGKHGYRPRFPEQQWVRSEQQQWGKGQQQQQQQWQKGPRSFVRNTSGIRAVGSERPPVDNPAAKRQRPEPEQKEPPAAGKGVQCGDKQEGQQPDEPAPCQPDEGAERKEASSEPADAGASAERMQEVLESLCDATGMVPMYARMCLEAVRWDRSAADMLFAERKGSLPDEAWLAKESAGSYKARRQAVEERTGLSAHYARLCLEAGAGVTETALALYESRKSSLPKTAWLVQPQEEESK